MREHQGHQDASVWLHLASAERFPHSPPLSARKSAALPIPNARHAAARGLASPASTAAPKRPSTNSTRPDTAPIPTQHAVAVTIHNGVATAGPRLRPSSTADSSSRGSASPSTSTQPRVADPASPSTAPASNPQNRSVILPPPRHTSTAPASAPIHHVASTNSFR